QERLSRGALRCRQQRHGDRSALLAQLAHADMALAMNSERAMIAIRSVTMIVASALILSSCASAEREDNSDRAIDELGSIQQLPHDAVCSGGKFHCTARVRTNGNHAIKPFAAPQGFGPADIASAYKLDTTKGTGAVVAIVDAFGYANAESD